MVTEKEKENLDKLAALLKKLDESDIQPVEGDESESVGWWDNNEGCDPLLEEIEGEADACLITDKGTPHYRAHQYLRETHGFRVKPGETDSFGWLTGVIVTKRGYLVYG
jgi:hypothetical protein